MKSYSDLEQSKKLTEILPIESADMYYISGDEYDICFGSGVYEEIADWSCDGTPKPADKSCWSFAALFDVLPSASLDSSDDHHYRVHCKRRYTEWYDNPIDACVEMILKLNELKLL